MTEITKKAQRRLSEFNFEAEGSHVALVGKHQGGPANGVHTLITKATDNVEEVQKAEVAIRMDIVSFLSNFFHMWEVEAATLATIFGIENDFFDEDFTFEEFNSLGETEVTLLKSASDVDKTEETLSAFVTGLDSEDLNTLKALAESFNIKLQEHNDMSTELEKALEAKTEELEKAFEAKMADAVAVAKAEGDAAKVELEEINKAAEEAKTAEFVELAKSLGAEEDLGVAMAVVSATEQGALVIKALKDAHKRLDEVVEKEAGFTGEAVTSEADTSIMKAMKNKYETNKD
tara:strand:- start:18371 stop:19240 length:870 start_codon:yes stop_codon:yes gene_type:complete